MLEIPDECPCETCIVLCMCPQKMCRKDHLIVEYLKTCPLARYYILQHPQEYEEQLCKFYFHKKMNKICELFGVKDKQWVWRANELGIYK